MKKRHAREVMKEFYREYQENPEGWNFWMSPPPSSDDFYEAYMLRNEEAFFLKLDSIFTPNPVGVGAKMKIEEGQFARDLPDFGYRKFSERETERFLKNLPRPEDYNLEEEFRKDLIKSRNELVDEALRRKPVPFNSSEGSKGLAAIGPYSSESPLDYVSEKQKELRKELSKELEKLTKREYPGYY